MSQNGSDIKRKRIPEIDFWRGFALIVILVDHIPWNGLDFLTPQNFGFSDAAEVFVFLSGVSVSLAYAPTLQKAGFGRLVRRCATRAAKLYVVQIAMVACSIAIPLAAAKVVGDQRRSAGTGTFPVCQLSRFVARRRRHARLSAQLFRRPGALCRFDALGARRYFSGVAQFCFGASCVHRSLRGRAGPRRRGRRWLVLQSLRLAACVCDRHHLRFEVASRPAATAGAPRRAGSGHHSWRRDPVHKGDGSESSRFGPPGSRQARPRRHAARAFPGACLRRCRPLRSSNLGRRT